MAEETRGTDRAGRPATPSVTPLRKYESLLWLVRREVTVIEAAAHRLSHRRFAALPG